MNFALIQGSFILSDFDFPKVGLLESQEFTTSPSLQDIMSQPGIWISEEVRLLGRKLNFFTFMILGQTQNFAIETFSNINHSIKHITEHKKILKLQLIIIIIMIIMSK